VSLGLVMALSVSRLGQGQAREAGTEKSDVSGANLSRAARSIAYALARASPPGRDGGGDPGTELRFPACPPDIPVNAGHTPRRSNAKIKRTRSALPRESRGIRRRPLPVGMRQTRSRRRKASRPQGRCRDAHSGSWRGKLTDRAALGAMGADMKAAERKDEDDERQ